MHRRARNPHRTAPGLVSESREPSRPMQACCAYFPASRLSKRRYSLVLPKAAVRGYCCIDRLLDAYDASTDIPLKHVY
eukprot:1421170-Pyramimonas_sp.AAC.1